MLFQAAFQNLATPLVLLFVMLLVIAFKKTGL